MAKKKKTTNPAHTLKVAARPRKKEKPYPMTESRASALLSARAKISTEKDKSWADPKRTWHPDNSVYINDKGNLSKKPYYNQIKKKKK
jgi:polygalacturonase